MASKIKLIITALIIFVCCQIPVRAQENALKIPDHIHKMFIEFDTCMTIESFKNLERYKSLFHKDVVDTVSIIHDLYYTGPEFGFVAKSPLKIDELNQVFTSTDKEYITNIRGTFLQFGERITLQSRYGYKLYQYRLNKLLYYQNYKKDVNEFKEVPYYISLLSYNDPNNSTLRRASIIKVSTTKTTYPSRFTPESLTFDFQQGISSSDKITGISKLNYQAYNLKTNFLLTGKKYFSYYFQLGVGYYNSDFNTALTDFSESYNAVDVDGSDFQKHAIYKDLSQKNKLSFIEIPVGFKAQFYRYKNVFNFFASAGMSYYVPANLGFTNTLGSAEYYGSYQFGNNFSIDLKDLPEYGFTKYPANTSENSNSIKPLTSVNTSAGINLRVNKKLSLEAGVGFRFFLNDVTLKETASAFSSGEGNIAPLVQKLPADLSMASANFGLTYNISPVRSPYYPIIDKRLLNLKENKISHSNLTSEKIKLSPSSNFIMKNLKTLEYQFRVNNQSVLKQGKISKKGDIYFLNVKIPKDQNHLELVKRINYNFWTGGTEVMDDNMLLPVDLNNNSEVNISKIPDLDIVVLFKFSSSHPDNMFSVYDAMSKRVDSLCEQSSAADRILFANNSIQLIHPDGKCNGISSYLTLIQDQLDSPDMNLIEDFMASFKQNKVTTKGRNINLHVFYLYKDMVFNTDEQMSDFIQMYKRNVELISKLERVVFGNQFNKIKVVVWSNFNFKEVDLLNRYRSINQINWEYKIY
ncbi:MAG: hypothetical protein JZU47_13650 [Prolixibacteraceae bacterium]|nr:hypothetical protein [Prolixibacteraceae bacterium]